MKKLYRLTAYSGSDAHIYYVVATNMNSAEEAIRDLHVKNGWMAVEYCDVDTVAEESKYGNPALLIIVSG